jgi:hypothetical protein
MGFQIALLWRARIIIERAGAVLLRCDILPRSAVSQAQKLEA